MKNFSLIFWEILFLLFILFLLPSLLLSETNYYFREGGTNQIALNSGHDYSFLFDHPQNLNSLSLRLKNPLIRNNSRIMLKIENNDQQKLADFIFYGSNVGDPGWVDFSFPPQNYSTYIIKITTDNTIPESLFILSDEAGNWDLKTTYQTLKFSDRLNNTYNSFLKRLQNMDKIYLSIYLIALIGLNWLYFKK